MKIVLDGQERSVALEHETTLNDVLSTLKPIVDQERKVICDVCVDGVCLSTGADQSFLQKEIKGIQTLELHTDSPAALAVKTLGRSLDFLKSFQGQVEKFLDVLQLGGEESAFDTFVADLNGLRNVVETIELSRSIFNIDFNAVRVGSQSVNEINDELLDMLTQVKTSIEDQDLVYLQDLLRYELIPATDKPMAIVQRVRDTIPQN